MVPFGRRMWRYAYILPTPEARHISWASTKTPAARGMRVCHESYLACHILNLWIQVSLQPSELHSEPSTGGSICPRKFSAIFWTRSFCTEIVLLSVHWNEGFPISEQQGIILKKPNKRRYDYLNLLWLTLL